MDFTQSWLSETPTKFGCSAAAKEGLLKGQNPYIRFSELQKHFSLQKHCAHTTSQDHYILKKT